MPAVPRGLPSELVEIEIAVGGLRVALALRALACFDLCARGKFGPVPRNRKDWYD
jgi:hypothetical protein